MQLSSVCSPSTLGWQSRQADVFSFSDENGVPKTVFRYALPFHKTQDAILVYRYNLSAEERAMYYQTLVQGIQRTVAITRSLKANNVKSILTFDAVEQESDPATGQNQIYIQTEAVKPICQVLFQKEINILTLLDVFIRLSIIVRDISADPILVQHRGICMDEIYMSADNKILMGGFYHAVSPGYPDIIPYLPDEPSHFPVELKQGAVGDAGTDMQTLARMLFNYLSGLPWDTQWPEAPRVAPAFAPEGLPEILLFGMSCTDEQCNQFRRRLLDYRKNLSKTALATLMVPVCEPYRKEYIYQ